VAHYSLHANTCLDASDPLWSYQVLQLLRGSVFKRARRQLAHRDADGPAQRDLFGPRDRAPEVTTGTIRRIARHVCGTVPEPLFRPGSGLMDRLISGAPGVVHEALREAKRAPQRPVGTRYICIRVRRHSISIERVLPR
jgi:hypothetical protein